MDFPKRNIPENAIPIDLPEELGYTCPCNYMHSITWSEYECHLWCYDCEKDYPSCFCTNNLMDGLETFYSTVKRVRNLN